MAAKVFEIGSASFDGDSITGITNMSFENGSGLQSFFADGDLYTQFIWMENIEYSSVINTTDMSLLVASGGFEPGDVGVLLQTFAQRAAGAGGITAGSTALKATWTATTMLGPFSFSAGQTGTGDVPLSFHGVSVDGVTAPVAFSLAAA